MSAAQTSRTEPAASLRYAFEDFELDPGAGRLVRGGVAVDVDPKPLELLAYLIQNRDRVVPRGELREAVWRGTAVSEAAVASVVRDLRRALGDTGSEQRIVRTARGAGFRFVAEVVERRVAPPRGAFVGRRVLLERIEGLLAAAGPEGGRWLWIAGESGMGKTRLLVEVARRAAARGVPLHLGGCLEEEGAAPLRPWLQILRSLLDGASAAEVEERWGAKAAEVQLLLPEWSPSEPGGKAGLGEEPSRRSRAFDGLVALLRRAGLEQPVVLGLDDVHRADAATRKLLHHLLGELPRLPVLVLATYRASEAEGEGPLAEVLGHVAPGAEHCALEALGEADALDLAAAVMGRRVASGVGRTLWQRSEGNPLFVEELARELSTVEGVEGELSSAAVSALLPGGIRQALRARLARLPAEVRGVLEAASILGREIDVDVLFASLDEEAARAAPAALDRALAAGLLLHGGAPGRLRFAHILARDVLYAGIPELRREGMHGRAGRALERLRGGARDALAAELAHHFGEATALGEAERAFRYARQAAADAMQQCAYEAAAALAERALRAGELLPPGADADRAVTLVALGDARWCCGETAKAREAFERAAELARESAQPEVFAQAAFGVAGRTDVEPQVHERSVALLEEALASLPEADSPLRARLLARLGTELYYAADAERREALTREALAMAERLGEPDTLAYVLSARGFVMFRPGFEPSRRLAVYERQFAVCQGSGEMAALACCEKFVALMETGDVFRAEGALVALERLVGEVRQPFYDWRSAVLRAAHTFLTGRVEEALAQGQQALALGQAFGSPNAFPAFGGLLLFVRREQGRMGELEPAIRELVKTFELFRSTLPLVHLELGRTQEARDVFEQVMAQELEDVPRDLHWLPITCWLAITCAALRDTVRARLLYRLLAPLAGRLVVPGHGSTFDASVDHHLGRLAATFGDLDAADEHYDAAVAFERRAGARLFAAHSQRHWADVLWKRGAPREREQARDLIARAAATYRELGFEDRAAGAEQVTRR